MAALLLACLVVMLFDGREIRGVSVWVKPAKFAGSLALWCWSLALAWSALAEDWREGRAARAIVAGTLACGLFEVGWITLRAMLGEPSHFARDALGAAAYGLMGLAALLLCLCAAGFGALVAARGDAAMPRLLRGGIALGFLVAGLGGAATGFAISANLGPYVGAPPTDAGAWPPFFWSRDGGDLRVAHFVAVHAMQALPLLAWALLRLRAPAAAGWLAAGTLGWVGLAGAAFALASAGRAALP
ncbi:hypothetical protein J5Y09_09590 [Roseomonas sp. PWR1]|uniref:Uncharacterized protein n=1 Tax=Roseomonas nitratireducens TaxID=2820810 RepID=A0ABS4AS37_9PROT|nr:hypothetical protein [Neoroseomonas nitratireducens]MBP0464163.1 hypothetical protein [Neoroseomonas nitratireducens]